MRHNFELVCMFTPALVSFYFMRIVAKDFVARNIEQKGTLDADFKQVIDEINTVELEQQSDVNDSLEFTDECKGVGSDTEEI